MTARTTTGFIRASSSRSLGHFPDCLPTPNPSCAPSPAVFGTTWRTSGPPERRRVAEGTDVLRIDSLRRTGLTDIRPPWIVGKTMRTALLLGVLLSAAPCATAEDAKDEAAKRRGVLASELRSRASTWGELRKGLIIDCPTCNGQGSLALHQSRVKCSKCAGSGRVISRSVFIKTRYDIKSPSWRALPEAKSIAEAEYVAARQDIGTVANLKSFRISKVEVFDNGFGVAWVFENSDQSPTETRWVFATDRGVGRETWWLFDERGDGPWSGAALSAPPADVPVDAPGPTPEEPKPQPVSQEVSSALSDRLRAAAIGHRYSSAEVDGSTLVVYLTSPSTGSEDALVKAVSADLYPATMAAAGVDAKADTVKLVFVAKYRDRFGTVEPRAYMTASISRADFRRIVPERLTPEELLDLWVHRRASYKDYVLWFGK